MIEGGPCSHLRVQARHTYPRFSSWHKFALSFNNQIRGYPILVPITFVGRVSSGLVGFQLHQINGSQSSFFLYSLSTHSCFSACAYSIWLSNRIGAHAGYSGMINQPSYTLSLPLFIWSSPPGYAIKVGCNFSSGIFLHLIRWNSIALISGCYDKWLLSEVPHIDLTTP